VANGAPLFNARRRAFWSEDMFRNSGLICGLAITVLVAATTATSASNYQIDWMQQTPTPVGSPLPFSSSYFLPGVGTVQMTYSAHPDFLETRHVVPQLQSGNLNFGGDNYSWTNHEMLARTNWGFSGVVNSSWFVTYTFPNTVPAGNLMLGVMGLGRRDPLVGESANDAMTTATVLQNGTHLGDWTGALNVGPTQFTSNVGQFSMINSLTGPGGQDPWWNTGLGVVRIDDAVNSLTVRFDHTSGDGVGVNIGYIVPEPASMALLGLGGLVVARQKRRRA